MTADVTAKTVEELRGMTGVGMMDTKKILVKIEGDMEKTIGFLRENDMTKVTKKNDRVTAEGLVNVVTVDNVATIAEVNSGTDFVPRNEVFQDLAKDVVTKVVKNKSTTIEEAMVIKTEKGIIESDLVEATTVIGEKTSSRRSGIVERADNAASGTYLHMDGCTAVLIVIDDTIDEEVAKSAAMCIAVINSCYINESQVPQKGLEHEKAVLTKQASNEGKPANIVERTVVGHLQRFKAKIVSVGQPSVRDPDMTVEKFIASRGGEVKLSARFKVGEGIEKREDNFADEVMSQMEN